MSDNKFCLKKNLYNYAWFHFFFFDRKYVLTWCNISPKVGCSFRTPSSYEYIVINEKKMIIIYSCFNIPGYQQKPIAVLILARGQMLYGWTMLIAMDLRHELRIVPTGAGELTTVVIERIYPLAVFLVRFIVYGFIYN